MQTTILKIRLIISSSHYDIHLHSSSTIQKWYKQFSNILLALLYDVELIMNEYCCVLLLWKGCFTLFNLNLAETAVWKNGSHQVMWLTYFGLPINSTWVFIGLTNNSSYSVGHYTNLKIWVLEIHSQCICSKNYRLIVCTVVYDLWHRRKQMDIHMPLVDILLFCLYFNSHDRKLYTKWLHKDYRLNFEIRRTK